MYSSLVDLHSMLPPKFLTEALDDNSDGSADAGIFDQIASDCAQAIDGRLGQRYNVPFTYPYPPLVAEASRVFIGEALYLRRGFKDDKNPFTKRADELRKKLDKIGAGEEPFTAGQDRAKPSASIITEKARSTSTKGRFAA